MTRIGTASQAAAAERGPATEQGAGTVLVLGIMAAALLVIAMIGLAGQVIVARHRAQAAADLAALSGAASAALALVTVAATAPASEGACGVADRVAAGNGARIESCSLAAGGVIEVRAVVPVAGHGWSARAQARAGPAHPQRAVMRTHNERSPVPRFGDGRWA